MLKNFFEWFIIAWTSLLVFLIIGYVLKEFYAWDVTIVSAIIAFVGAIFGGFITLLGVKQTIDTNNLVEEKRTKREELMYLYPFLRELVEINEKNLFDFYENHCSAEDIVREYHTNFSYESKLYDYAQRSSGMLYNKLHSTKDLIDFFMEQIYREGTIDGMTDHEVTTQISGKISDLIKDVRREIYLRNS